MNSFEEDIPGRVIPAEEQPASGKDDDLGKMLNTGGEVTIKGVSFTVAPIKVKQLKKLISIAAPLMDAAKRIQAIRGDELQLIAIVNDVLISNPEEVAEFISVCTGITTEEFDDLDLDEAFNLVVTCFLVNVDFFTKRLLPSVLQETGRLLGAVREIKVVRDGFQKPSKS